MIVASETSSVDQSDQLAQEENPAPAATDDDAPQMEDQGDQTMEEEVSANESQVRLIKILAFSTFGYKNLMNFSPKEAKKYPNNKPTEMVKIMKPKLRRNRWKVKMLK